MQCPYCHFNDSRVLDSRFSPSSSGIRRRRECLDCGKRFTTYETVESIELVVVKRDGRREPFNREKLLRGLLKACEKRPIKRERVEQMASDIEAACRNLERTEVKSKFIGEIVMQKLKETDEVAYVRFASVYRRFKDAQQFMDEIRTLNRAAQQPRRVMKIEA